MTAALDSHSDPFTGVFGARRGGGRSHPALPDITGPASFDAAIAILADNRDMLAGRESQAGIAALADYLAAEFQSPKHMEGARTHSMLGALGYDIDTAAELVHAQAVKHIRALTGPVARFAQPWEHAFDSMTDLMAHQLALVAAAGPGGALQSLMSQDMCEDLDELARHNYQEFNPSGDPTKDRVLLELPAWKDVMRKCLSSGAVTPDRAIYAAIRLAIRADRD